MFAVAWVATIVYASDSFAWWLSPILAGLLTAIPFSVWGSRVAAGRAMRRHRLLLTPEEVRVPAILANAGRESRAVAARLASFIAALADADAILGHRVEDAGRTIEEVASRERGEHPADIVDLDGRGHRQSGGSTQR